MEEIGTEWEKPAGGGVPISKQRENTVTVHLFSFPKDFSLHFIDFFKVTFGRCNNHLRSFGFCLAF